MKQWWGKCIHRRCILKRSCHEEKVICGMEWGSSRAVGLEVGDEDTISVLQVE